MPKRRKFSVEFKQGGLEQLSQSGVSCAQVTRELGISCCRVGIIGPFECS